MYCKCKDSRQLFKVQLNDFYASLNITNVSLLTEAGFVNLQMASHQSETSAVHKADERQCDQFVQDLKT